MKKEIICEKKRKDAIQPTIGSTLALFGFVLFGFFDIRKMGVEISSGIETTMYWIIKIICIILIPFTVYLLCKFVKQLCKGEVFLKISDDGIYLNIHKNLKTTIQYEDIENVSYKEYPNNQYMIFLFLKEPSKYLNEEQIDKNRTAKEKIPESGDIAIPSLFINTKKEEVIDLINSYLAAE